MNTKKSKKKKKVTKEKEKKKECITRRRRHKAALSYLFIYFLLYSMYRDFCVQYRAQKEEKKASARSFSTQFFAFYTKKKNEPSRQVI